MNAAAREIGDLLSSRGQRLATAESCTGGLLASLITDVPGSSAYFYGGVVVYSNAAKRQLAGVPEAMLALHGPVSEPVARALAAGVRERTGADVGLATTGWAGPHASGPEELVGLVYVAVADAAGSEVRCHRFGGDRREVKEQAASAALELLRDRLRRY